MNGILFLLIRVRELQFCALMTVSNVRATKWQLGDTLSMDIVSYDTEILTVYRVLRDGLV